jgi:phosphodiester glycosidase
MSVPSRHSGRRYALAIILIICLSSIGAGYSAIQLWPDLGGQGADLLRNLFGDQLVASIETTVFQAQDRVNSVTYRVGAVPPAAPWDAAPTMPIGVQVSPAKTPIPMLAHNKPLSDAPILRALSSPVPASTAPPSLPRATGVMLSTSPAWHLLALPTWGTITGAGQWTAYLRDSADHVVAERAFLQPDPDRPYAVTAIVAFDLRATRLHIVLGSDEPRSPVVIRRTGVIPAADHKPGVLLAAFNGGFKARHGHFGVMVDGTTVLPAIDGFGTVAVYRDGQVRIGAWGTAITPTPDLLAWRQNGPLVIENGQINPHTADSASHDWGIILNGVTAVWRSGLAISADGRTLYYVAGNSLTLPMLVRTLTATGASAALQLDINVGMVHFDAIQSTPAGLVPAPLFASMQSQHDDRFLTGDKRDFFYVTNHDGS